MFYEMENGIRAPVSLWNRNTLDGFKEKCTDPGVPVHGRFCSDDGADRGIFGTGMGGDHAHVPAHDLHPA